MSNWTYQNDLSICNKRLKPKKQKQKHLNVFISIYSVIFHFPVSWNFMIFVFHGTLIRTTEYSKSDLKSNGDQQDRDRHTKHCDRGCWCYVIVVHVWCRDLKLRDGFTVFRTPSIYFAVMMRCWRQCWNYSWKFHRENILDRCQSSWRTLSTKRKSSQTTT